MIFLKLLTYLLLMILGLGLSFLTMIYGWGVHPQSWAWIIGGSIGSILFMTLAAIVEKL